MYKRQVSARLLKIAEERRNYKADVQADIEHTQEEKNALRVLEQFPAIEPVSYTHLDVYKRQHHIIVNFECQYLE